MAVLAPLVEELVFRGLLYGWLAGRWGTVAAWIVSSLAFAAAHVEPAHIILVLPLGLWFGWLRRRTNSLWPSLVAHMVNNGFAVAAQPCSTHLRARQAASLRSTKSSRSWPQKISPSITNEGAPNTPLVDGELGVGLALLGHARRFARLDHRRRHRGRSRR